MVIPSRKGDREQLEQEIQTEEYQKLLDALHRQVPSFRQFTTWMDIVMFMRDRISTDSRKDEVLRSIFKAHGEDRDPRWRGIILLMFMPALENLYSFKRRWDPNPDCLWSNVMWAALEVISRIDVNLRPNRLAQKIYNDVVYYLHNTYLRQWDHGEREEPFEQERLEALIDAMQIDALAGRVDCCTNFIALGLREEMEAEICRLRGHMEAGRISEADFLMLVGTTVYGESLSDYAREAGLDYQLAKKRRQRAEATIRRFEEKQR